MSWTGCCSCMYRTRNFQLEGKYKDWVDLFAHVYADLQVHCLRRGASCTALLKERGTNGKISRLRIERRMRCADVFLPRDWGVTYVTDDALRWWEDGWAVPSKGTVGERDGLEQAKIGLTPEEKRTCKALFEVFAAVIRGGVTQVESSSQPWRKEASVQELEGRAGHGLCCVCAIMGSQKCTLSMMKSGRKHRRRSVRSMRSRIRKLCELVMLKELVTAVRKVC